MAKRVRSFLGAAILTALCLALMGAPSFNADDEQAPPATSAVASATAHRPPALVPLYVSFVTLQALDVDSTYRVLHQGGREANPIAASFVGNPAALIGFKAATAAGAIAVVERVRKRSPKAAMWMMIGFNSVMATVVAHNYSMAAQAR